MNYLTEILAFYDWASWNPIVTSHISLWHALMYIANKTGWQTEFTVPMSTLKSLTGLKETAIYDARNKLKQMGRIDYRERSGNQCSIYSLCPFNGDKPETNDKANQRQTRDKPETNDKYYINKIKQKDNISPDGDIPLPPKDIFSGRSFSPAVQSAIGNWLKYKNERREGYKPTGLISLLSQIENKLKEFTEERVIFAISESMACNYKGIIWDKAKTIGGSPRDKEPESDNIFLNMLKERTKAQ